MLNYISEEKVVDIGIEPYQGCYAVTLFVTERLSDAERLYISTVLKKSLDKKFFIFEKLVHLVEQEEENEIIDAKGKAGFRLESN